MQSRLNKYFHEAAELRACVQRNMDDFKFSSSGGSIIYLVDANVVRLFCEPLGEQNHIRIFSGQGFDTTLAGTAIVTAEFIFSRGLAGQGNRPCYLSPPHLSEFLGYVKRLENHERQPRQTKLAEQTVTQLIERIQSLSSNLQRTPTFGQEIAEAVQQLVATPLMGNFAAAVQCKRLINEDLLRPIQLHETVTDTMLEVVDSDTRTWTGRIQQHDNALCQAVPQRKLKSGEQARRDAETLVQLERLNEGLIERQKKDPKQAASRCVLITTDIVVYEAYALWFWSAENSDKRPERFALRRPAQYIPLLNIAEMPNGIGFSDLAPQTSAALDSLLGRIALVDAPHYPHSLCYHAARERVRDHNNRADDLIDRLFGRDLYRLADTNAFKELRKSWNDAFIDAVTLNWELLERFLKRTVGPVLENALIDRDEKAGATILNDQRKLLQTVEYAHTKFMAELHIGELVPKQNRVISDWVRILRAVRARFHESMKSYNASKIINDLMSEPDRIRRNEFLDIARKQPLGPDFLFFSACLAFRCGDWTLAHHYTLRAYLKMDKEPGERHADRHEIAYLCAVAGRLMLPTSLGETLPETLLAEGRQYYVAMGDRFGMARADAEFASLMIDRVLSAVLNTAHEESLVEKVREFLVKAHTTIENGAQCDGDWRHSVPGEQIEVVRDQILANIISYELLCRELPANTTQLSEQVISRALYEIHARLDALPKVIVARYWQFLAKVQVGSERAAARKKIEVITDKLRTGTPESLATLDLQSVEWFTLRDKNQRRRTVLLS